jgi:hypothetical protein
MIVELAIFMYGKMPTKETYWNISSIIDTMYDTEFNPMAWLGDYVASKNDASYVRVPQEAPQDVFYAIIPWAYQFLWTQLVWTFDPIWYAKTNWI